MKPFPPYGWTPRREPGESNQTAIDRYEQAINHPSDDDAPRNWEP